MHDALHRRGGHDRLYGGRGDDVLDGASGVDWADYWQSAGGVRLDLTAGRGSWADPQGARILIRDDVLTLAGVDAGSITIDDFVFA